MLELLKQRRQAREQELNALDQQEMVLNRQIQRQVRQQQAVARQSERARGAVEEIDRLIEAVRQQEVEQRKAKALKEEGGPEDGSADASHHGDCQA